MWNTSLVIMFIDNVHILKSALTFKIALNDVCNGNVKPCQVKINLNKTLQIQMNWTQNQKLKLITGIEN